MSVSTEVQRTLVKSPPELWAELSSPERLGHHFGEVGEIRVTKVEPECKVEWEADGAKGVVELEQSGWGTKVTLSLTRELPVAEEAEVGVGAPPTTAVEAEALPEAETLPEAEATTSSEAVIPDEPAIDSDAWAEAAAGTPSVPVTKPEPFSIVHPEPSPEPETEPSPETETEPEPSPETEPVTETRPGFFARIFRRRSEPIPVETPAPAVQKPEIVALATPEPDYPPPPAVEESPTEPVAESRVEPVPDLAAELADVEAQMEQETTELLTGVLDRLGAAHHRPFSRG
jgi:outer membrane biosynthesis protein TonB